MGVAQEERVMSEPDSERINKALEVAVRYAAATAVITKHG